MQSRSVGNYTIAGRELVAEGADLRVQVLTLAAGEAIPWHYHSEIADQMVCLEGPMVVETRAAKHPRACAGRPLRGAAEDRALRARQGRRSVQIPDRAGGRGLRFRAGRLKGRGSARAFDR